MGSPDVHRLNFTPRFDVFSCVNEKQLLFIERCWRYIRLKDLNAPAQIIESAKHLVKESAQELEGDEIAVAVMEFPSDVAVLERIDREIMAEHPLPK